MGGTYIQFPVIVYGAQLAYTYLDPSSTRIARFSWDGAKVSWYSDKDALSQLNESHYSTYSWVAIG